MSLLESIKNILSTNSLAIVSKINLSYIDRLFPNFKNYIIIYKKEKKLSNPDVNEIVSDDYDFDVTGNPLEYSFGDDKFSDTTLIIEGYWYQEEESYLPFSRLEACTILNICLEHFNNDYVMPVFVLCNGEDHNRTTLLGCFLQKNWLNTIEVTYGEKQILDTIKNGSSKLLSDHLKLSFSQPCDVSINSLSTYHLFGSRHETLRLSESEKSYFKGSVTLNIINNNMLFDPPTRSSNNSFILEIITGRSDSVLVNLWHQLLLLNQYIMILDTYKKMNSKSHLSQSVPLKYPDDFINPCAKDQDKTMENINLLLIGDYSYRKSDYGEIQETYIESDENNMKLKQNVEATYFRPYLDFTDLLWEILMCISNYEQMVNCMHKIFEEILSGEFQPELNVTNNTKLAKLLPELPHQKTVSHLLVGCLPLETLIDIGLEKLSRDYKYILVNTGLATFNDIRHKFGKSPESFDIEFYRQQLVTMIRIYISLEFMLLLQTQINCSTSDLQPLFEYVLKEITSIEFPIKALQELHQNKIYSLTIPTPGVLISELNKSIPEIWRVNLVSESKLSKTETITYFSDMPIFPPTMYHEENTNKVSEVFHVTTAMISSTKVE